jgi:PAS domain S-box-containing protein
MKDLREQIAALQAENAQLHARIAELEHTIESLPSHPERAPAASPTRSPAVPRRAYAVRAVAQPDGMAPGSEDAPSDELPDDIAFDPRRPFAPPGAQSVPESGLHNHALLQNMLDHLPVGIYVKDRQRRYLLVNHYLLSLLGMTHDEVVGSIDSAIFPESMVSPWRPYEQHVFATGQPTEFEETVMLDGQVFTYLTIVFPIFDQQGDVVALGGSITNISARKQAEEALRENRALLQSIIDAFPDMVALLDTQQTILAMNQPIAQRLTADCGRSVIGAHLRDVFSPDVAEATIARSEEAISSRAPLHEEVEHEGRVFDVLISPLCDNHNTISHVAIFSRDITHHKETARSLQQSQGLLQGILDYSPTATMVKDTQGRTLLVNRKFATMFGMPPDHFLRKSDAELFPPEMVAEWRAIEQHIIETGQPHSVEEAALLEDGVHTYLSIKFPIFDTSGMIYAIAGLCTDITERKQMEEALQQSEERYQRAVSFGSIGVWDWNIATGEMYIAPNLKAMLGYADHELPNRLDDWVALVHPDDLEAVMESAKAHMCGETSTYEVEHRMLHRDGSVRWIIVRGNVIRDAEGNPIHMAGTDADITQRKLAEEALREKEALLQGILDNSPIGITVKDMQGSVVLVNRVVAERLQMASEEIVGQTATDLFAPEIAEGIRRDDALVQATGQIASHERPLHINGEDRDYLIMGFPIYDVDGQMYALGNITTDITEHKRAQRQLLAQQHALATLRERERLARELHDNLGQVLNYVHTQAQATRELVADQQHAQAATYLQRMIDVTQEALTDVREFILGVKHHAVEQPFLAVLQQYIQRVTDLHGLHIELSFPAELEQHTFSPATEVHLLRIIQEALTNIRKHTPLAAGRISFAIDERHVQIIVADDGEGFDMARHDQLSSRGYGLRSMRERAAEVGGALHIDTAPGKGTRIIVALPLEVPPRGALVS